MARTSVTEDNKRVWAASLLLGAVSPPNPANTPPALVTQPLCQRGGTEELPTRLATGEPTAGKAASESRHTGMERVQRSFPKAAWRDGDAEPWPRCLCAGGSALCQEGWE